MECTVSIFKIISAVISWFHNNNNNNNSNNGNNKSFDLLIVHIIFLKPWKIVISLTKVAVSER